MTKFDAKWVAKEQAKRALMAEQGLYREDDEHSSCGISSPLAFQLPVKSVYE